MGWEKHPALAQVLPLLGTLLAKPKVHSRMGLYVQIRTMFELGSESPNTVGFLLLLSTRWVWVLDAFRLLRPKHQAKIKLLLVVIICGLEVPAGARYDTDPCAVQTHGTQRCIKVLAIQIPELGDHSSILPKLRFQNHCVLEGNQSFQKMLREKSYQSIHIYE